MAKFRGGANGRDTNRLLTASRGGKESGQGPGIGPPGESLDQEDLTVGGEARQGVREGLGDFRPGHFAGGGDRDGEEREITGPH